MVEQEEQRMEAYQAARDAHDPNEGEDYDGPEEVGDLADDVRYGTEWNKSLEFLKF